MSGVSILVIILSLLSQNDLVSSAPTLMNTICIPTAGNYTAGGAYQNNLGKALTSLTTSAVSTNATNTTVGIGHDEVFALYYCTGGVTAEECSACIQASAAEVVEKCPNNKEAITWYLECTLRYANRMIAGIEEDTPWAWLTSNKTVPDYNNLGRVVINMTSDLTVAAAFNSTGGSNPLGFAAKEAAVSSTETLVGLMQCAPGVTGVACAKCLSKAVTTDLSQCCNLLGYINLIFLPSCRLHFNVQTLNLTSSTTPPPISYSPESSPPVSSPPVPPSPNTTAVSPFNNGRVGSDGTRVKCGNNGIAVIALAIFLVVCLASG